MADDVTTNAGETTTIEVRVADLPILVDTLRFGATRAAMYGGLHSQASGQVARVLRSVQEEVVRVGFPEDRRLDRAGASIVLEAISDPRARFVAVRRGETSVLNGRAVVAEIDGKPVPFLHGGSADDAEVDAMIPRIAEFVLRMGHVDLTVLCERMARIPVGLRNEVPWSRRDEVFAERLRETMSERVGRETAERCVVLDRPKWHAEVDGFDVVEARVLLPISGSDRHLAALEATPEPSIGMTP